MKLTITYALLIMVLLFPFFLKGQSGDISLTKVSEWGAGPFSYQDVYATNHYAYCAAYGGGLEILDIRNPNNIHTVGQLNTPENAMSVYASGKFAYIADDKSGLQVIDISVPTSPVRVGYYQGMDEIARQVIVSGDYAYLGVKGGADAVNSGFIVIDISNPSSPFLSTTYNEILGFLNASALYGNYIVTVHSYYKESAADTSTNKSCLSIIDISSPSKIRVVGKYVVEDMEFLDVSVYGHYAYVATKDNGLQVFDLLSPSNPTKTSTLNLGRRITNISVEANFAYIIGPNNAGYDIFRVDVQTPSSPVLISSLNGGGYITKVYAKGDFCYACNSQKGLDLYDVSTEPEFSSLGNHRHEEATLAEDVFISGNNAYVLSNYTLLSILDISNPSNPQKRGSIYSSSSPNSTGKPAEVFVSGNYAYIALTTSGIKIADVSNPASPEIVWSYSDEEWITGVHVQGHYAYVSSNAFGLRIYDVSNPQSPVKVAGYGSHNQQDVFVSGDYAYLADAPGGLRILNVSDPTHPTLVAETGGAAFKVHVNGNYAYMMGEYHVKIYNVSNPANPLQVAQIEFSDTLSNLTSYGNYLYVTNPSDGLQVYNVSDPSNPAPATAFATSTNANGIKYQNGYVYLAAEKFYILKQNASTNEPRISLSRNSMAFAADSSGIATGSQKFFLSNSGSGNLNWQIQTNKSWIYCSPTKGIDSEDIQVSVNPTGLAPGTYTGVVEVIAPLATNSPQKVTVTLTINAPGQTAQPFGDFSTPLNGDTVRSSIAVTGWALDDIGVQKVQLFREEGINRNLTYIGDAVFVEGARPDVASAYPNYPNNTKAGWGYMLLTNFLPNNGNGTFVLHAIATDSEGHEVTLGTKTIICDNEHAIKPFGALDTPAQGGLASGTDYIVWGWALTPAPNTIPVDGSTINVWVDGVQVGHPVYNIYRPDISAFFPGYNNSDAAVGYFYLDTTKYENGIHTVQWTVKDDAGNSDGIGSRYFTIQNSDYFRTGSQLMQQATTSKVNLKEISLLQRDNKPIEVYKGYDLTGEPETIFPDSEGITILELEQLERLEIRFKDSIQNLSPQPVGSSLNSTEHSFSWQPGPAHLGVHHLFFLVNNKYLKEIIINITHNYSESE